MIHLNRTEQKAKKKRSYPENNMHALLCYSIIYTNTHTYLYIVSRITIPYEKV